MYLNFRISSNTIADAVRESEIYMALPVNTCMCTTQHSPPQHLNQIDFLAPGNSCLSTVISSVISEQLLIIVFEVIIIITIMLLFKQYNKTNSVVLNVSDQKNKRIKKHLVIEFLPS